MVASRSRAAFELDQFLLDAVLRRLNHGEPISQIARDLAIDRRSVRRLRDGEHVSQQKGPRKKRCPGCGGKVLMPCRLCAIRNNAQSS